MAKSARKWRRKTARHVSELIEIFIGGGLFRNPLPGGAEEHGFKNTEDGQDSDAVAAAFGRGRGHFQNGGLRDSFPVGLRTLRPAA